MEEAVDIETPSVPDPHVMVAPFAATTTTTTTTSSISSLSRSESMSGDANLVVRSLSSSCFVFLFFCFVMFSLPFLFVRCFYSHLVWIQCPSQRRSGPRPLAWKTHDLRHSRSLSTLHHIRDWQACTTTTCRFRVSPVFLRHTRQKFTITLRCHTELGEGVEEREAEAACIILEFMLIDHRVALSSLLSSPLPLTHSLS